MEPPLGTDDPADAAFTTEIAALIADGHRSEAVHRFLTGIGVPPEVLAPMEPMRPALDAVAHTLVYDCMISDAIDGSVLAAVSPPTLVLDSHGSSDDIMGPQPRRPLSCPTPGTAACPGTGTACPTRTSPPRWPSSSTTGDEAVPREVSRVRGPRCDAPRCWS